MQKLKIMTIVGTRPEIIRLSEVIKKCEKYFEHVLVHTGQNWDNNLNSIFFQELNVPAPKITLGCVGENLGDTLGKIISESYKVISNEKPDAVLILGDTNSALSAISAKRLKVPIFHMEAGNRCFDENVPEEINRKIVDHISEINLAYTEHSRRYLLSEGLAGKNIFVTGSPMPEVINANIHKIQQNNILEKFDLQKNKYFVLSTHREENVDNQESFLSLLDSLNYIADKYNYPIIFSTHPRTKKAIQKLDYKLNPLINSIEPLGFFDYCSLQVNSACVLSDSGTLSEESSILGFPAVLLRNSTERPEALEKASVIMGNINKDSIEQSIELAISLDLSNINQPHDYTDLNVSEKIVRIIQSYSKILCRK